VSLTKAEIGRAVAAVRELSDLIERLEKASWPETQNDVLRKSDLLDGALPPRASRSDDATAKAALAALADAQRRLDKLEAGRDMDSQSPRKTYSVS
jgi:hypothetical protein